MTKWSMLLLSVLCLVACGKPSAAGTYSFDALSEGAKALMPGADKIELSLKEDGKMSLDAGRMTLLSGTWKEADGKVTFSQGQGLIGAEYRVGEGALIPLKNGEDETAWRFKKK